ncbi:MAG: hypothetical protein LKE40_10440 [Spirochaetia bacterium]|nr:hypothetical protein [Spirochaetia bacterium]
MDFAIVFPIVLFVISVIFSLILSSSGKRNDRNSSSVRQMMDHLKLAASSSKASINDTVAKAEERMNGQKSEVEMLMSQLDGKLAELKADGAQLRDLHDVLTDYRGKLAQLNRASDEAHDWAVKVHEESQKLQHLSELIDAHEKKTLELIDTNDKAIELQRQRLAQCEDELKAHQASALAQLDQAGKACIDTVQKETSHLEQEKVEIGQLHETLDAMMQQEKDLRGKTEVSMKAFSQDFKSMTENLVEEGSARLTTLEDELCKTAETQIQGVSSGGEKDAIAHIKSEADLWLEKMDTYYQDMVDTIKNYGDELNARKMRLLEEVENIRTAAVESVSKVEEQLALSKEKTIEEMEQSLDKHYAVIDKLERLDHMALEASDKDLPVPGNVVKPKNVHVPFAPEAGSGKEQPLGTVQPDGLDTTADGFRQLYASYGKMTAGSKKTAEKEGNDDFAAQYHPGAVLEQMVEQEKLHAEVKKNPEPKPKTGTYEDNGVVYEPIGDEEIINLDEDDE